MITRRKSDLPQAGCTLARMEDIVFRRMHLLREFHFVELFFTIK